jgi:hypothetical protein
MKKITLFTFTAFIILSTQSSCRKVYDYIREHPDGHESLCRITQIRLLGNAHEHDTFNVIYNSQGDPVSMLATDQVPNATNYDQYFRYDHRGRLSDYLLTFTQSTGILTWHKYSYPRNNFVVDTVINYSDASFDGPAPIAGVGPGYYYIQDWSLDAYGRIVNGTIYDANGNKVLSRPDLTYDNKVNPYRTSKIWQFVFNDYSRNNIIQADHSFMPVYNEFGLPLSLPNLLPLYVQRFGLDNTGPQIDISYACAAPNGPVNY